jgi:hypothetical protein
MNPQPKLADRHAQRRFRLSRAQPDTVRTPNERYVFGETSWRRHVELGCGFTAFPTLTVVGSDPLVDGFAVLLAMPLRELYALLWRAGVVEIVDGPAPGSAASARSRRPGVPATLGASVAMAVAVAAIAIA